MQPDRTPSAASRYCADCGGVLPGHVSAERPHQPICECGQERSATTGLRETRKLLASKHHCSPDLHRVGTKALDDLERAFRQACTNLATVRPSGRDTSLGEDADSWAEALLNGLGSPW